MNFIIVLTLLLLQYSIASLRQRSMMGQPEGATLDFPALARTYGYKTQEHNVTTEDGYILKMFNIPGNKNKTVLLMHGIFDSADTFILRGNKSLAALLAQRNYDVWLGNIRGNKYSRRHVRLNPDTDKMFWNFSFHEMGSIDLPTLIDYILHKNSVKSLSLIGHSQGNALFCVLGCMKPEYNNKVNIAIALAPACLVNVDHYKFPMSTLISIGPVLNRWLVDINQEEIFSETSFFVQQIRNRFCTLKIIGYDTCAVVIFGQLGGEDLEEFEPEFFYSLIRHYPVSSSRKNLEHFRQAVTQRKLAQFDYGSKKNLVLYKSKKPPVYDLNNVTMKMALFTGKNDKITPMEGVENLKNILPNVISYRVMEREKYNHIDHIWGREMYKYLFPFIIELLEKYS